MVHYEDKPYLPDPFSLKTEIIGEPTSYETSNNFLCILCRSEWSDFVKERACPFACQCVSSQKLELEVYAACWIHMSNGKGCHMLSLFHCDCTSQHHSVTGAVGVQYFRISTSICLKYVNLLHNSNAVLLVSCYEGHI